MCMADKRNKPPAIIITNGNIDIYISLAQYTNNLYRCYVIIIMRMARGLVCSYVSIVNLFN